MSVPTKKLIANFFLASLIAGCSSPPITPEQYAAKSLLAAYGFAKVGDAKNLRVSIDYVALYPTEAHRLKEFFARHPDAVGLYAEGERRYIDGLSSPGEFARAHDSLDALRGTLPNSAIDLLSDQLVAKAKANNLSDETPFILTDKLRGLGLLESPDHMLAILKRTVDAQGKMQHSGLIQTIAAYMADPALPPTHSEFIEASLDDLYITEADLVYVAGKFPEFAKRRKKFLDGAGPAALDVHIVRQSVWDDLSEETKAVAKKNYRVFISPDSKYGAVADVQTVNRSTAGSNAGSTVGAGVAQIAYIDRSFDNMNYSPWSQLGVGLLGAIAGSAANTAPTERYQHFYTIRRSDGEMFRADQMTSTPERMAPSACVAVPSLAQVSQKICEATPDDLEKFFQASPLGS